MFLPHIAERRFGYGLSPQVAPPVSVDAMLQGLTAPDEIAARFAIEDFDTFRQRMVAATEARKARKAARNAGDDAEAKRQRKARNVINKAAREAKGEWLLQTLLRRAHTPHALRERLVSFWGDHFTAQGKAGVIRRGTSPFIETAIRPHIAGRFEDMLVAAVTSPLMLHYLDQTRSMGPKSARAIKKNGKFGMNENLAREVIELHTLGVAAPYSQTDVTQLAELLTGLTFQAPKGTRFRKDFAEPGAEVVLGRSYGPEGGLAPIRQVLRDLARHPATARHIARKLAVHFIADTPPKALVDHLAQVYKRSGGALIEVYAALLGHEAAWQAPATNFRPPLEFMSAAFRALAVPPGAVAGASEKEIIRLFYGPLSLMGQTYQKPGGPDGWPEEDEAWVTPQGIAARLEWAVHVPRKLLGNLPDPRVFVETVLPDAPQDVHFAAAAAESRHEAIGIILCAPAFQRR